MTQYKVIISRETYIKTSTYLDKLKTGSSAGGYLKKKLSGIDLANIDVPGFLQILVNTKKPQIFAESGVIGDGIDWSHDELSILGDITFALPVTIYDNGRWSKPDIHDPPFEGTLLYTSGALLSNRYGIAPVDENEVVKDGSIDLDGFYRLYERRLLPALRFANQTSKESGHFAFITLPGLGCGFFAGGFKGKLSGHLKNTLIRLLQEHGDKLEQIKAIYFDPHSHLVNERLEIHNIQLLVRPLESGNQDKPQLCRPVHYQEKGDDFSDCHLFCFVAWDHVSWPGNDFYINSRNSDDGVKAAATDTMHIMTGIEGQYDPAEYKYLPPPGYDNWEDVVLRNNLQLHLRKNLIVFP